MNALKFATYGGIVWALATILLIIISLAEGDSTSWVELDFRALSGVVLIGADLLGFGDRFRDIIQYADYGMPITVKNLALAPVLGFVDGFVSAYLIALLYNALSRNKKAGGISVLYMGVSAGIVFGVCSAMLGLVSILYGMELESFDFSIKPVQMILYVLPSTADSAVPYTLKHSYLLIPKSFHALPAWTLWGFVDGFIGGGLLTYIFISAKSFIKNYRKS